MEPKIIRLFEEVQRIPYRICKFEKQKINRDIPYGSCRHKSELLYQLSEKEDYPIRRLIVVFDWNDLPIPRGILDLLKESGTIWKHNSLEIKIGKNWFKVDPTWNSELKEKGFPVTENWDGKSDTKQITEGKLEFYCSGEYTKKIPFYEEERTKFAIALNKWLEK